MRPKQKKDIRKKYTLSEKQLMKIKQEVTEEAVTKTGLLYLVALAERGWTDDDIADLFQQISRYTKYLDDKLVKIKEIQAMIEEKTGIVIKGKW